MPTASRHIFIFCVSAIMILVFILFEPSYGWRLRDWLSPVRMISNDDPSLPAENQWLKARLAELESVLSQIPENTIQHGVRAMVYSSYPFGYKNQLMVNIGKNEGVAEGNSALFEGIYIGKIITVFPEAAIVQTIFDPAFRMPVRLGGKGSDGLLVGGSYPLVTSINRDASLSLGDAVISTMPGVPYGVPLAQIVATSTSPDAFFEEASLEFAYNINDIKTLIIAE